MSFIHIYEPVALNEYEDATFWYREKSIRASERFVIEVETTLKTICSDPYKYKNTYKNLREVSLKKYPFNLIYFIDDVKKIVTITSVFHHSRNLKKKYKKPKKS